MRSEDDIKMFFLTQDEINHKEIPRRIKTYIFILYDHLRSPGHGYRDIIIAE